MDKYIEAINNISSYEIWHECTYDDGYSNFDDWIEYPFEDDEDIKLLSGLITKHDNLNKGINELITEYYKLKIVNDELLEELFELEEKLQELGGNNEYRE